MATMMTNAKFYEAVINANLSEEITAKAKHLLEVTENKSAQRSKAQSATRQANVTMAQVIAQVLAQAGRTMAVSEIKVALGSEYAEVSTSKISAVCKVGVEEGILSVTEGYKVGGKGREVKGYSVA